jgi:hypothetical protein
MQRATFLQAFSCAEHQAFRVVRLNFHLHEISTSGKFFFYLIETLAVFCRSGFHFMLTHVFSLRRFRRTAGGV